MGAAKTYSTQGLPAADRLSFWNEGAVAIGGVEVEQIDSHPFHGTVVRRTLGAAKIFGLDTTPHRAAWTRRLIEKEVEAPHLRICFQQKGTTLLSRDGGERIIRTGEWFVADGRRPYVSLHREASCKIALQVPVARLPGLEVEGVRRVSGSASSDDGIGRMLLDCLQTALRENRESDETLDSDLGETLIDLMRLLLREATVERGQPSMRDLTQERICAFIRRNLGNPALSVDMIAQAMRCSKRYVHKVFNRDQTVSEYIWAQRLEQCRALLSSPHRHDMTLTQIAFENGFSSSAHFSRAFREKFGKPPKAFRTDMLGARARRDKNAAHAAASGAC